MEKLRPNVVVKTHTGSQKVSDYFNISKDFNRESTFKRSGRLSTPTRWQHLHYLITGFLINLMVFWPYLCGSLILFQHKFSVCRLSCLSNLLLAKHPSNFFLVCNSVKYTNQIDDRQPLRTKNSFPFAF